MDGAPNNTTSSLVDSYGEFVINLIFKRRFEPGSPPVKKACWHSD
jgi:hypothetical protein